MKISHLDHLVLTVKDLDASADFYTKVLGMERVDFDGRITLKFGHSKINLHQAGKEFEPKAEKPTPGSADLCFISEIPLAEAMGHIQTYVDILEGPCTRTGAMGKMHSIYFRDPDLNLIEVSSYPYTLTPQL
jgi:catechol 2,3-dioxygenase-like lactoylglutathione lyase family enzyme